MKLPLQNSLSTERTHTHTHHTHTHTQQKKILQTRLSTALARADSLAKSTSWVSSKIKAAILVQCSINLFTYPNIITLTSKLTRTYNSSAPACTSYCTRTAVACCTGSRAARLLRPRCETNESRPKPSSSANLRILVQYMSSSLLHGNRRAQTNCWPSPGRNPPSMPGQDATPIAQPWASGFRCWSGRMARLNASRTLSQVAQAPLAIVHEDTSRRLLLVALRTSHQADYIRLNAATSIFLSASCKCT